MGMTFREMNLRVFQRKPIPHVLFQPRMEPWFAWHRIFGTLPAAYKDMDVRQFYDACGCSMRTFAYYTDLPSPVYVTYDEGVQVWESQEGNVKTRVLAMPVGELVERQHLTVDQTWRVVDFAVKGPDDLRTLGWLFRHTHYHFSEEIFAQGSDFIGERGVPQFWVPKSPYQALAQQWMKLADLVYAIADMPDLVADVMQAIDDSYDALYEELTACSAVQILNFGENLHDSLFSPAWFERYLLPWYEKRAGQLAKAGIYTHIHMDGYFHSLLPYLKDLPFDGLEALTPQPQGDVTVEEMAEAMGDKILLDGIPAVLFAPPYSREELMAMAEKIVALFHPRLVLGISDEVPEGAGEEAIERVKMVAAWAREQTASEAV